MTIDNKNEVDHSKDQLQTVIDAFIYIVNEDDVFDALGYSNG